ncbi:MAG: SMP-30/gluconolactonase/LRE family protein [Gemmataceae bacterium]
MKYLSVLALLAFAGPAFAQGDNANVPIGDVVKLSFEGSKIFPGTYRDVWIYIPKQYDGKTPACVHVNQDGIQFNMTARKDKSGKTVPGNLDVLIHNKKIPVMIGVFVMHGRVKAADPAKALDRYNRSYEYDGLGDAYVRFLLEELLPWVETKTAPDGRKILLSKKGNDRSIGGTSSGAICAFTAAWERPDAFSRVYSGIGTYVGLRGGHNYSTLIRKVEPKPIRVFLEDGSNDLNIYGGDWWMANQAMERSLKFAGYDVEHNWGTGGHSNAHSTEIFSNSFAWLWRDYPEPIKAGVSPPIGDLFIPGQGWELVGEGYGFTEGAAVNAKGEVFFNQPGKSKTFKVGPDGKPVVFLEDSKKGDGQIFGPDGRLYSVATGVNQIIAYDANGKGTTVADGFKGNDIVVRHDGGFYVTDPYTTANNSKIWFVSKTGEKKVVDNGLKFVNGICLSPDQTLLYAADYRSHWVYSYQVQPDGSLLHKQKYYHLHVADKDDDSGADGMRVDKDGRLWIATRMGLQVADQPGRVNAIIPIPGGSVSNLTFGGEKFDTLYVTAGDKVYRRKVKVTGANNWDTPTKPKQPGL